MNGDCVHERTNGNMPKVSITFSLEEKAKLLDTLKPFETLGINMTHIESRPSKSKPGAEYDFYVECTCTDEQKAKLVTELETYSNNVSILSREPSKVTELEKCSVSANAVSRNPTEDEVPWFPKKIQDLDDLAHSIRTWSSEPDPNHHALTDEKYNARKKQFTDAAQEYKHGQPIPRVEYTEDEIKIWTHMFRQLKELYPTHACKEFNDIFPLLVEECGFREDNIPQLEDINNFMQKCSGFKLRPVAGLLTARDFLAGLAFRVFHATQYVRHESYLEFCPDPDTCHEILGHVPLFCDPTFAQFSQDIGLASLGAPDEYIDKLSTLFWFTIEVGLCKEGDQTKAYGAALLSAYGELEYCLSDIPEVRILDDPASTCLVKYSDGIKQPVYFAANSFKDVRQKFVEFAKTIPRPFSVRYDPYTESVEVINDKPSIQKLVNDIKYTMDILQDAMQKVN